MLCRALGRPHLHAGVGRWAGASALSCRVPLGVGQVAGLVGAAPHRKPGNGRADKHRRPLGHFPATEIGHQPR